MLHCASDVICERFYSRYQWGPHRSVVWAESTVFPRIHLPSGVHGHPGGRYERWEVTWTENKVTETINLEIFLTTVLVSGHPSSVRKDAKIRRAAISLLGIGDCALMIGSHHLLWTFIIYLFFCNFFFLSSHPVITDCFQYTGYCWLKRSDGLRIPHPKIIIGPKFCAPTGGIIPIDAPSAREPCAVTVSQEQVLSINL